MRHYAWMTTRHLLTKEVEGAIPKLYRQEQVDEVLGRGLPRTAGASAMASITGDWNAGGADTAGIVEALTGCKRLRPYEPIAEIAGMTTTEIRHRLGITRRAAVRLQMGLELGRRMATADLRERSLLNEPHLVKEYLRRTRGDGTQERTGALYVNARNRLLRDDPEIYKGTLDRAVVEPREVLKRGLLLNAAGIILYHNHPSGDPSPSREDREFTRRLASAAESVGLRLLDHIVVGHDGCVSFREAGLM
jgi:DNA repair protein RadC